MLISVLLVQCRFWLVNFCSNILISVLLVQFLFWLCNFCSISSMSVLNCQCRFCWFNFVSNFVISLLLVKFRFWWWNQKLQVLHNGIWNRILAEISPHIFTRDQFASIKNLAGMPVKTRPLRSVRNQFEHPNDSLQWLMLLFSYMKCFLWNIKCET